MRCSLVQEYYKVARLLYTLSCVECDNRESRDLRCITELIALGGFCGRTDALYQHLSIHNCRVSQFASYIVQITLRLARGGPADPGVVTAPPLPEPLALPLFAEPPTSLADEPALTTRGRASAKPRLWGSLLATGEGGVV